MFIIVKLRNEISFIKKTFYTGMIGTGQLKGIEKEITACTANGVYNCTTAS